MTFTVRDFDDLLRIIEQQPEWRSRLRRALFPEIDVPKALQALAEAQLRTESILQELKQDVGVLKQDVSVLKQDVGVLKQDVGVLKQDVGVLKQEVGILKGRSQEQEYYNKATGIFGPYLRKGRDATEFVADQLYDAFQEGNITEAERRQVLVADLLWMGEERQTRQPLVLVMEASWLVESSDVVRALTRANLLRKVGLLAMAVVGGEEWTIAATELGRAEQVVRITDRYIEPDSWLAAWSRLQASPSM